MKGDFYVPACGQCAIPPWEECACSALLAEARIRQAHEIEKEAEMLSPELQRRLDLLLA